MKKLWLIVGAVLLVGLAVAGVVFGPGLYHRFFGAKTPLGLITSVEAVDVTENPSLREAPIPEGHQVWVVKTDARKGVTGASEGDKIAQWLEGMSVADSSGEQHRPLQVRYVAGFEKGEFQLTGFEVYFSLPRGRQPAFMQFRELPPVRLPRPSK